MLLIEGLESCTPSITAAFVYATPASCAKCHGPPDRSNRADPPRARPRRGRPDLADFAGATDPGRGALEQAIIGKAADLLSGPGGLASFLRTQQLGARLAGPSLPLDVGFSKTIPPGIRNAVILRDRRCRWSGGCNQPASACEVHHVKHKARGGKTST